MTPAQIAAQIRREILGARRRGTRLTRVLDTVSLLGETSGPTLVLLTLLVAGVVR
jgi:hypothetical protein